MNNNIKEAAKTFLKEYNLREVTLENLKKIINQQGYTIIEYNSIYNDENLTILIEVLNIRDQIENTKGFTYADAKRRIVFLNEDLSDSEKLLVLAHEEGHIYCKHLYSASIMGQDVVQEHEANEFTHYILKHSKSNGLFAGKRKIIFVAIGVILVISIAAIFMLMNPGSKVENYYKEYVVTTSGSKYHREDCVYVEDKTNIRRLTVEEFESGEYEPCKVCINSDSE